MLSGSHLPEARRRSSASDSRWTILALKSPVRPMKLRSGGDNETDGVVTIAIGTRRTNAARSKRNIDTHRMGAVR